MKLRFIEYQGDIMVVVGITYIAAYDPPECYVAVYIQDTIISSVLLDRGINVPFSEAVEITDPKRLAALWVLYGR